MAPTTTGTYWWERVVVQRSASAIDCRVESLVEKSSFLQENNSTLATENDLAVLQRDEVQIGALLGHGSYSNVYEVTGIHLNSDIDDSFPERTATREALQSCVSSSSSSSSSSNGQTKTKKFAIKHLKPELLKDTKLFEAAAADLVLETMFLSRLSSHPNILQIRGVALGGTCAYSATGLFDGYFIVVDKLQETLGDRIGRWRKEQAATMASDDSGAGASPIGICNNESSVLAKKIQIALQIANALAFLHDKNLVFRDLKPDNCGFRGGDEDNHVQLFDFGFVRELPNTINNNGRLPAFTESRSETDACPSDEEVLHFMTGKGTLMYMAGEVMGTRRYNQKVDVYGWATIFYEMLTLKRPYTILSIEEHRQAIYKRGERPPLIHSQIPPPLQNLLKKSWDANVGNRLTMREASSRLEKIQLGLLRRGHFGEDLVTVDHCLEATRLALWDPIQHLATVFAVTITTSFDTLIKSSSPSKKPLLTTTKVDNVQSHTTTSTVLESNDDQAVDGHSAAADSSLPVVPSMSIHADDKSVEVRLDCNNKDDQQTVEVEQRTPSPADAGRPEDQKVPYYSRPSQPQQIRSSIGVFYCPKRVAPFLRRSNNRKGAPWGRNGTLLYHKYYGHVNLGREEIVPSNFDQWLSKTIRSAALAQGREYRILR